MSIIEAMIDWAANYFLDPDGTLQYTLTVTQGLTLIYIGYNLMKARNTKNFLQLILKRLIEVFTILKAKEENGDIDSDLISKKIDLLIKLRLNELATKYSPSDIRYVETKEAIAKIERQMADEKDKKEEDLNKLEEVIRYVSTLIKI